MGSNAAAPVPARVRTPNTRARRLLGALDPPVSTLPWLRPDQAGPEEPGGASEGPGPEWRAVPPLGPALCLGAPIEVEGGAARVSSAELQPALAVLTAHPPADPPSEALSTAWLLTCGKPRAEALQHGARLPAGRQVSHVCLQPALLAGRLRHPGRWHLAGCHAGELCHPVCLLPILVGRQPAHRHRHLRHGHWLHGLHWGHQREQVPPAHLLCDAAAGVPAGGHHCHPLLRLHGQDRQVRPARPEEGPAPVRHPGQRGPHQRLEHHPDRLPLLRGLQLHGLVRGLQRHARARFLLPGVQRELRAACTRHLVEGAVLRDGEDLAPGEPAGCGRLRAVHGTGADLGPHLRYDHVLPGGEG
nr:tetraspanin-4 isoform X2 [Equus asinus]